MRLTLSWYLFVSINIALCLKICAFLQKIRIVNAPHQLFFQKTVPALRLAPIRYGGTQHFAALIPLTDTFTAVTGAVCLFPKKLKNQPTDVLYFEYAHRFYSSARA